MQSALLSSVLLVHDFDVFVVGLYVKILVFLAGLVVFAVIARALAAGTITL